MRSISEALISVNLSAKNIVLLLFSAFALSAFSIEVSKAAESSNENESSEKFDAGKLILDHISDSYDWHLWGHTSLPLPIIVYSSDRGLDMFMSGKFHHGHDTYKGYAIIDKKLVAVEQMESVPVEDAVVNEELTSEMYDISLKKNAVAMIITMLLMMWMFISVARSYTRHRDRAPKGLQSLLEPIILFVRDDIAIASIGEKKYERYMPFLLTIFFFIWLSNLLGLIPIAPGGANVTGNIAVPLVLAVMTFLITSFSGNKHYWRHIIAMPGVPGWVLLLLTPIEIMGVFLKPFVLMVRLFANITAGHIIVLSFFCLIFIFGEMYAGLGLGVSVLSLAFTIFMTMLELLVAFLQAYVFTLLAAIYFAMATEEAH